MPAPKDLRHEAWTIVQNARKAWDEAEKRDGGPNDEDKQNLDAALTRAPEIEAHAARVEKLEQFEQRFETPDWRPTGGGGRRDTGGPEWARHMQGPDEVRGQLISMVDALPADSKQRRDIESYVESTTRPEYRSALAKYMARGQGMPLMLTPDEQRALSEGVDTEGGFLVPADVDLQIIRDMREPAVVRGMATVRPTVRDVVHLTTGDRIDMGWFGEAATITEQDTDFGQVQIHIGKLGGRTKVSREELEDAAVNLIGYLQEVYAEAAAFKEDEAFMTGNGVNRPVGITFGNRVTRKNTAANDTFAADDIVALHYAVPARYRRNGTYVLESGIEEQVRKFKGSDNNYLWQPGLSADRPPTLMGRPIANTDGILATTVADANEIVVFGDYRNYHVRDRIGTSLQRLDELYAETDQVGFIVRRRVGGNVGVANAFRILKVQ